MARISFQPNDALAEQLRRDRDEQDEPFRGFAGETTVARKPPPPPRQPRPFIIEKPDWEQEERERKQRELQRQQQERERILAEELARLAAEDTETYPAAKKKLRWRP